MTDPLIAQQVLALEESLLENYVRRRRQGLAELLAEDFREFGSAGRILTREHILESLASQPGFRFRLQDFAARTIGPDAVLATYRATAESLETGQLSDSLRSSLWVRRGPHWQVVFHQGTRVPR